MSLPRTKQARLYGLGLTCGAIVAAGIVGPQAAAYAAAMVGPSVVQAGGNAVINDPQGSYNAASAAVQLSLTQCAAKFTAPGGSAGPWTATVNSRSATAIAFTVPSGPVGGTNGTVKPYYACVYEGAVPGTSNLQGTAAVYVGTVPMLSSSAGLSGGGGQITVTANQNQPLFAGLTSVAAVFSATSCNATLGVNNPAGLTSTAVKQLSSTQVSLTVPPGVVSTNGTGQSMYNLCLYDGSSANGALLSFNSYTVNNVGLTPAAGSYLISNGVTASAPTAFLSGVTAPAVLLVGMGGGCPGAYTTAPIGSVSPMPLPPAAVRRLTTNRAALTLPPLPISQGQPTPYSVCFYAGTSTTSQLLGTASYLAGIVANPTGVLPAAGPAAGGNTITVTGTDFPTDPSRITATLGGAALINIQPINDKAFTATAPQHAIGAGQTLVVSTSAGTKALPGAYAFLNPIAISPNTAPNTAPTVDVDVQGTGFMNVNFGISGTAGRVFLVNGVYNGSDAGGGSRANGPVAECGNVLPISDQELVCTLQLNRRLNTAGTGYFDSTTYTNTLTTDVSTVAGSRTVTSTAGKFSMNDVGQPIVQTSNANIPAGSIVSAVRSPYKADISAPAIATSTSAFTAVIGNSVAVHQFTGSLTTTAGSTTVTTSSGAFTRADVGRVFSSTTANGISNGTTVLAVAPGGGSATLSAPASASTVTNLTNVVATDGSATISTSNVASGDVNGIIGANSIGIPAGTTITSVNAGTSALLSAPSAGGGVTGTLPVNHPVSGSLYAASPVPDGSYNLVVVSNGAPDAADNDPTYTQTDVTSSSAFTVAAF
jgi:hypothetical protein